MATSTIAALPAAGAAVGTELFEVDQAGVSSRLTLALIKTFASNAPTLVAPLLGIPASGDLSNCTFPTLNQNTTGSAAKLTTARNINGVAFDGAANITVTAAAGTLSGATLAAGVTASSLTSFGASPTLVTPTLGVATATSINKITVTQPATGSTLTIGDGFTLTVNANTTLNGSPPSLGANTFTALQTITQASANAGIFASTGYSLTGSNATNMLDLAGTLNTSGAPVALKVALTNTASGASTKFFSFLAGAAGASEKAYLDITGAMAALSIGFVNGAGAIDSGCILSRNASNGAEIYASGGLGVQGSLRVAGTIGDVSFTGNSLNSGNRDLYLTRSAAAILQQGQFNAAAPIDQTLQSQGSRSGTDNNVGGSNYTITSGLGTGTGAVSSLIFKAPTVAASGTGAQTMSELLRLNTTTGVTVKSGVALQLGNAATTGLAAGVLAATTNASIVLTDSNGQAYRIPCII